MQYDNICQARIQHEIWDSLCRLRCIWEYWKLWWWWHSPSISSSSISSSLDDEQKWLQNHSQHLLALSPPKPLFEEDACDACLIVPSQSCHHLCSWPYPTVDRWMLLTQSQISWTLLLLWWVWCPWNYIKSINDELTAILIYFQLNYELCCQLKTETANFKLR